MTLRLPEKFINYIMSIHDGVGQQWLNNLPHLLALYSSQWHLKLQICFENLSYNYVAPGITAEGKNIVLKCGMPNSELMTEISALTHFNGVGAVKLLQADVESGVLLLERIMPGTSLEKYPDVIQAMSIAVQMMKRLHKPIKNTAPFPTLKKWFLGFEKLRHHFDGGTGPFPEEMIDRATHISEELLSSMGELVLLHGDLHYDNILFSQENNEWLAIDPKGVIGEAEYEIPLPILKSEMNKKILIQQLQRFVEETGFDRQRILGWLFAKAVLAAWWSYEDMGKIDERFIACAEVIATIKF